MHSRRALLYVPGDDRRKIEKSTSLGVDCICMDMEDGVAISRKQEARAVIAQAMKELDFGDSERCIRINSIGSGLESYDLIAALATNPDTIVVPKIETADQVNWVSDHIESYEISSGREAGSVRLLAGDRDRKGEGSAALGNFFQISDAATLGLREEDILEHRENVAHDLIVKEKQAQEGLLSRARSLLEDRIWRSYGILRYARKLNAQETLQHASMLRLGTSARILDVPRQVAEILMLGQEAHTELLAGSDGDGVRRSIWRAAAIRRKLEGSQS